MKTKTLSFSCLMMLTLSMPVFSQEGGAASGLCDLGAPETEDVQVFDKAAMKALVDGVEGDCIDKLAAGIDAYVEENMKVGAQVTAAIIAADEVMDKFKSDLPPETIKKLDKLDAKWGNREGQTKEDGEEASCPMAKDDPSYRDCKEDKLFDEFGEQCDVEGLLSKFEKQEEKLEKAKNEINQVVTEIMKAKDSACAGQAG